MRRRRLDAEIVRRKLASSTEQAADLIAAGRVTVGGAPAANPGRFVSPNEAVVIVDEPSRYATRAGEKLAAAVEQFNLSVEGVRALDAGASGGGFTDCLLQYGARQVVDVDVGYGQLPERLRIDPRVEVRDRTNVRDLDPGDLGPPFDLVVADLSFISLRLVIPNLIGQGHVGSDLVLLVKPQFEATKAEASRGKGVVRDPEVWRRVLVEVVGALRVHGAEVLAGANSPIRGAKGNVEFLVHAALLDDSTARQDPPLLDVDSLVEQAISVSR